MDPQKMNVILLHPLNMKTFTDPNTEANATLDLLAKNAPYMPMEESAPHVKTEQNSAACNTNEEATDESSKEANNSQGLMKYIINKPSCSTLATTTADQGGSGTPPSASEEDAATFPQQLMDVIDQEAKEGATVNGERVLDWLPSGDGFIIRDKAIMEKEVLPRHFTAKCKFMSFVRKLYR